ncbi:transcriptional attenuator%2C LytR family [Mycobacterium tuberculosis]|nr:transcriptional attenuator%2C LytR family [Mycobacterium tuberculosis]
MDDLDLIRDLGRDLEHPPPASLGRQRSRLLDAARRRRRGPGRWTLLGVVAAVTAAAILVPATIFQGRDAAPVATRTTAPAHRTPLNVLLLGSDSRNDGYPPRSDTMILVHVPADRRRVRAVSIPRDSLVRIPACRVKGETVPAREGMINSVLPIGGVTCVLKTVESLTNVRIDRAVVIDFAGFRRIVDALGGVPVRLPRAVADPASGLELPPGEHRLDGRQALAYVRLRHGLGDGSDLARVERQQQFLAAFVREVRARMDGNPVWAAKFLAVAARSVETTPRMDVGELRALAGAFAKGGSIELDTVPVRPSRRDPNRLEWDSPRAERMFATFRTP